MLTRYSTGLKTFYTLFVIVPHDITTDASQHAKRIAAEANFDKPTMTKTKTNAEFIKECNAKHAGFYDYSITKYTIWNAKIKYICPNHGIQEQRANDHRRGGGCGKCGREKTKKAFLYDTQKFIQVSNRIHNSQYDYSNVVYSSYLESVSIRCKLHGEFVQVAGHHLSGHGCPKCGNISCRNRGKPSKMLTRTMFLRLARETHGGIYDYTSMIYKQKRTGVSIICKSHGPFVCLPDKHLKGVGCPTCVFFDAFVATASALYPGKFEYDRSSYKNSKTKMRITCQAHGDFWQQPGDHIRKRSAFHCYICFLESKRITRDEFIARSKVIHGSAYGYDDVVLGSTLNDFVTIFCNKCQKHFSQRAVNHLQGNGCATCCESQHEKKIRAWLETTTHVFEQQKSFPGLRHMQPLKCDFYLPQYNLVIEFDGIQHFEPVKMFGGEERFAINQTRDQIKNEYCVAHRINLLRLKDGQDVIAEVQTTIEIIKKGGDSNVYHILYGKFATLA
ncbi:uncharacterized protein LALA0_S06e03422g [Lachancea lanzarotensis]|uniref:LALA0S06e03422g1_1 n=1 Tax=Lachancea lanzarotensis TaxID=1245769 RepID=A0A0C7N479_9SACH|nr:uncharacterized protein LALA0_S06e03422g [Lachancea lanzarotensis]CEP62771.1 LALA0S06e03422g1_1 [Lachancea lanzarotensis]